MGEKKKNIDPYFALGKTLSEQMTDLNIKPKTRAGSWLKS
jgi:hypothetical protein